MPSHPAAVQALTAPVSPAPMPAQWAVTGKGTHPNGRVAAL
ncbi:MAG TPA: hypothetical protein VME67_07005 [Mycobacterium sp.]|nr:hypothetical protein [Mycobacterium sp.]HTX94600.1 hypothetical protein [Mycobacterium sp.]